MRSGERQIPVVSVARNPRSETVTLQLAEPIGPAHTVDPIAFDKLDAVLLAHSRHFSKDQ